MEKKFEKRGNIKLNEIIKEGDETVYIRGVGGTGKTMLLEMFTLRWAKKCFGGKFLYTFFSFKSRIFQYTGHLFLLICFLK